MSREQETLKALGQKLKDIRQKLRKSKADVSGAVEIDAARLERIEQGRERPSEDILDLLLTHFNVPDDEAENLWHLAGYELPDDDDDDAPTIIKNTIMIMPIDPRVAYSDHVHATADQNGVVLNFVQKAGQPQPLTAARVGMSREQATRVARVLQEVLQRSEPRRLPRQTGQKQKPQTDK